MYDGANGRGAKCLLLRLLSFPFGFDEAVLVCFDKRVELDFAVERHDEFFDIVHDGLCVEVVGNAAAHSSNRFECVLQRFERRGVELGSIVCENESARACVETFCVCCCEIL